MEMPSEEVAPGPHFFPSLMTPGCVTFVWGDSRAVLGT